MNKTVVKTLQILQLFESKEQLTLQDMVHLSGQPKTSVFRMVQSLVEIGFLAKKGEYYELGLALMQFGQLVSERLDIRKIAYPYMQQLKNETNEAVNLVIQDGNEAIYIEKVETSEPIRVYTRIGRRAPLYAGACPRILLTFMEQEDQSKYFQTVSLTPFASNTIRTAEELVKVLEVDRKRGYSVSHSELTDGSSAVAVPIFDYKGDILAGLSIVGPESRFTDAYIESLRMHLMNAAKEIARDLGRRG